MKKAVQQIMLGAVAKNETQALESLKRVKAAGFDALELNRFMLHPSSLLVRALTRAAGMPTGNAGKLNWHELLEQSGLDVVSLHTDLGSLEKDPDSIIRETKSYDTDFVVITGMYRFNYGNESEVSRLAERLNRAGETLKRAGITLLYHNHNAELLQVGSGRKAYDILINETDPALLGFEFDSYWFADGGADAAGWMKKLGDRVKMWHVTDRGCRHKGPAITPILKQDCVELGTGSMDLDALASIATVSGIEAIVLETHKNWVNNDPQRSIELSAEWMNRRF